MHLTIRPMQPGEEAAVTALWHACNLVVPWNDPARDLALKLAFQRDLLLVALDGERIVGTVMVGYEGHRGAINYLGVAPECRRRGIGRLLMEDAERRLKALDCPKINLMVRTTNLEVIAFYNAIGYKQDPVVCLGKRLDS